MSEKFYQIKAGDKVIGLKPPIKGKIGTIAKIFQRPPSIDVAFPDDDPDLSEFATFGDGFVHFRLVVGEFEPFNKTIYSRPQQPN